MVQRNDGDKIGDHPPLRRKGLYGAGSCEITGLAGSGGGSTAESKYRPKAEDLGGCRARGGDTSERQMTGFDWTGIGIGMTPSSNPLHG